MVVRIVQSLAGFVFFIRKHLSENPFLILPAVLMLISWPMFQILFDDRAEAFMCAFVLAMAARLALRLDLLVLRLGRAALPRAMAILMLLAGPGILATLIWRGEPAWCPRFLSVYFLMMAALHGLDHGADQRDPDRAGRSDGLAAVFRSVANDLAHGAGKPA